MHERLSKFKASIFQALSHPTRLAIVEELRKGEVCAGKFLENLGLHQANLSQHLAILRSRHIVSARRVGNQIYYSLRDPALLEVLDSMRRYFHAHIAESLMMLKEAEDAA